MPPSAFEEAFARRAIAPLMPAPAKLAKYASAGEPSQRRVAGAADVDHARRAVARDLDRLGRGRAGIADAAHEVLAGAAGEHGELDVRRRPERISPLTTSCTVPSPPTATSEPGAARGRALGELDEVTGALAHERLAHRARPRPRARAISASAGRWSRSRRPG